MLLSWTVAFTVTLSCSGTLLFSSNIDFVNELYEYNLPKVGWVQLQDLESNQLKWVNTNLPKVRKRFADQGRSHDRYMKETFRKSGVDFAKISTGESYVKPLMNLFKNR